MFSRSRIELTILDNVMERKLRAFFFQESRSCTDIEGKISCISRQLKGVGLGFMPRLFQILTPHMNGMKSPVCGPVPQQYLAQIDDLL